MIKTKQKEDKFILQQRLMEVNLEENNIKKKWRLTKRFRVKSKYMSKYKRL
jgi:hypothetical protein